MAYSFIKRIEQHLCLRWAKAMCWLALRRCVTGRIKLRGDLRRVRVDPSFRCDGDIWLGVYSDEGSITICSGVSASGPLAITVTNILRIGENALFGPNVLITDNYHGNVRDPVHRNMPPSRRPIYSPGEIIIKSDVHFGANSVILSPATIGDGAIIAANAVVKGDVASMSVYKGINYRSLNHYK